MGYLKGQTLEYFATHMRSCVKAPGSQKRRLRIYADTTDAAEVMGNIANGVFGGISYGVAPDDVGGFAAVNFDYVWKRDYAVERINKEVSEYRAARQETLLENLLANTNKPEGNNPDPDEPEKEKTDWTTYIIIGAAALALVLLVWPKRKK